MEATPIKDEMLQYFSLLNNAEQQSVLNMLKTFIKSRDDLQNNSNSKFSGVTLKEYNIELEEADKEIEAGDYLTHEEVKKRFIR